MMRTVASTSRSGAKSPLSTPSATIVRSTSSMSTTWSRIRAAVSGERVAPPEVWGTWKETLRSSWVWMYAIAASRGVAESLTPARSWAM